MVTKYTIYDNTGQQAMIKTGVQFLSVPPEIIVEVAVIYPLKINKFIPTYYVSYFKK